MLVIPNFVSVIKKTGKLGIYVLLVVLLAESWIIHTGLQLPTIKRTFFHSESPVLKFGRTPPRKDNGQISDPASAVDVVLRDSRAHSVVAIYAVEWFAPVTSDNAVTLQVGEWVSLSILSLSPSLSLPLSLFLSLSPSLSVSPSFLRGWSGWSDWVWKGPSLQKLSRTVEGLLLRDHANVQRKRRGYTESDAFPGGEGGAPSLGRQRQSPADARSGVCMPCPSLPPLPSPVRP